MKGRKSSHTMTSTFLAPAGAGFIGGGGGGGGGGGRTTPKLQMGLRLGVPIAVRKWHACWAVFVFQAVHSVLLVQAAQHLAGDDGLVSLARRQSHCAIDGNALRVAVVPGRRLVARQRRILHTCSGQSVHRSAANKTERAQHSEEELLRSNAHQPLTTPAPPHDVDGVGMTGPEPGVSSAVASASASASAASASIEASILY